MPKNLRNRQKNIENLLNNENNSQININENNNSNNNKDQNDGNSIIDSFINFFSKYTEKGLEYSKILALKTDIFNEQRKIKKLMVQLGEIYYESFKIPEILKEKEEEINIIISEIDKRKIEIEKLKRCINNIKKKSNISERELNELLNLVPSNNPDNFEEEFINVDYIKKNKDLTKLLKKIKKGYSS
ncbi:MAG: hypothetical protein N3A58_09100 [Spirochaetes bacterium]|nr:hypothetical protein [Spirochaetota bacterium]